MNNATLEEVTEIKDVSVCPWGLLPFFFRAAWNSSSD